MRAAIAIALGMMVSLGLAAEPGSLDGQRETELALKQQRQRGIELRGQLRLLGDQQYDPDAALIKRFSPFFPRFTGHTVGQQSLEYALLLLHSDDRLYGTDDAGEANRIIRKILKYQDLREGSRSYGNFYWMTHWNRVKDANAVSFLVPGLVYAYQHFPHKLEEETKAALVEAFPRMLAGIRGHKVPWTYTNIFFLNLGSLVSLSRVLNDPSAHEEAVRDFETWLDGTANDGIHEFNSPTYTPVTLFGLEAAWANTPDARFRDQLQRTMDLMAYQMAVNMFPNGFLAGAASRAYRGDALFGAGWSAFYAYVKFGLPLPLPVSRLESANTMHANLTLFDYVPPEPIRRWSANKPPRIEIHDRVLSLKSRRTHVMTPGYSLSSQCVERAGGHSPPACILLVRHAPGLRRSVPFLPDESFSHQPCAVFQGRQAGNLILGRLSYPLVEKLRSKFLEDPTFVCETRALLGPKDDVREVRIGNVDWGGREVRLLPSQGVAVSYGELYFGVRPIPVDRRGAPAPGHVVLSYGEDGELRLKMHLFGGPELRAEDQPVDILLLVHVREPEKGETLAQYADWLSRWEIQREPLEAQHPSEKPICFPYSDADPDPLGDALHKSPGLMLRPGDLARIVRGELPFVIRE